MNILVTGASGFIGSYIVEEGLRQGHQVWAGVRKSSSKAYLQDERIRFACLDLSSKARLAEQLYALKAEMGGCGWDVVVHAAGATKCLHAQDFYRTNYDGTVHLVEALREAGMMPSRLVYLSSLSVFGAIREQPVRKPTQDNPWVYAPILGTDSPEPNTEYGRSKWKAEQWLAEQKDVPCTTLRPTGVYGPREKDYFLMAQSIKQHTDFSVGFKPQEITFVYVMDVVQAVFKCIGSPQAVGRAYFLSDGQVYNSRRFSDLLQQSMGNPWVLMPPSSTVRVRRPSLLSSVVTRTDVPLGTGLPKECRAMSWVKRPSFTGIRSRGVPWSTSKIFSATLSCSCRRVEKRPETLQGNVQFIGMQTYRNCSSLFPLYAFMA